MKVYVLSAIIGSLVLGACSDHMPTSADVSSELATAAASSTPNGRSPVDRFRVTIQNLTTGQVFSPGVMATHTQRVDLWTPYRPASEGIRRIAEDGNESTALAELLSERGVFDVVHITTPTNRIGGGAPFPALQEFEITANGAANYLSLAVMLICTNDGFTGLNSVRLPHDFRPVVYEVGAWDAGTELNNELSTHIVDPCFGAGPVARAPDGNARVATQDVIRQHPNIQGIGDLSVALHGWQSAVARITVQRIQ